MRIALDVPGGDHGAAPNVAGAVLAVNAVPDLTVVLVGDPRDSNFTESGPAAEKALVEKGYETIVLEHSGGHSMPAAEMKDVFAWIDAVVAGKKTTLATRRVDDGKAKGK